MRRLSILLATLIASAACSAPAKDTTAKPAAPTVPLIPQDQFQRQAAVGTGYSMVTAMMVNKDARSIVGMYAPDAILILPDSTVHNAPAIATRWVQLAQAMSMADFQRSSQGMSIIDDSTLADSGSYLMLVKRTPKDSVIQRGRYQARWRARAGTGSWVMLEDHIIPAAGKKKGAR
jgi:ketosteroid isomerase-like protein